MHVHICTHTYMSTNMPYTYTPHIQMHTHEIKTLLGVLSLVLPIIIWAASYLCFSAGEWSSRRLSTRSMVSQLISGRVRIWLWVCLRNLYSFHSTIPVSSGIEFGSVDGKPMAQAFSLSDPWWVRPSLSTVVSILGGYGGPASWWRWVLSARETQNLKIWWGKNVKHIHHLQILVT